MIKQDFDIDGYWEVIIFWDLDYDFFDDVCLELMKIDFPKPAIEEVYTSLKYGNAKAVTFSNIEEHTSIVLFNQHETKEDYLNSIVHEAEHIKQAMLKAYNVDDIGEPPAYTIGYLVMKMYEVFKIFICDC
jgi:hypothetical protein